MGGMQLVPHNQWTPLSSDRTPAADKMQYMYTFTSIIFNIEIFIFFMKYGNYVFKVYNIMW